MGALTNETTDHDLIVLGATCNPFPQVNYEFTDFLLVGGPLQLLLAVVATTGIAIIWGV